MGLSDIAKYAATMKEIKLRIEVIDLFLSRQQQAKYAATTIEIIGLQFRKIFELIAFATLAANKDEYSAIYSDFAKHWEAAKLIRNLRRINPRFYPMPVVEESSTQPGVKSALKNLVSGFLTEAELVEAHGRCGVLMHSANPFGKPIEYGWFERNFPTWREKTIVLLNSHQVHLLGDSGFYLFHMKEDRDDDVHWYRFQPRKSST